MTYHIQDVINLARLTNVPSLLPTAFYDISRFTFAQTFEPTDDEPFRFRGVVGTAVVTAERYARMTCDG
jgi:hypothetical protein